MRGTPNGRSCRCGRAAGGLTSAVALGQFVSTFAYSAIGSERDGASSFLLATGLCVIVVATAVLSLVARKAAGNS